MRKCPICNQWIQPEDEPEAVPYKNRLVHKACFNNASSKLLKDNKDHAKRVKKAKKQEERDNALEAKTESEVRQAVSEEEAKERDTYLSYLRDHVPEVTARHKALTNRYMEQFELTYPDMLKVLKYIFEVKKHIEIEDSCIVGLVPYLYEEANEYYTDLENFENRNRDKDISKMYKKNIVHIKKADTANSRMKQWDF